MKTCTSKIKIVILVCLLCIMFSFQTSYAYTYYVATNGLDTRTPTEARNISTPWRTLAASVNKLAAGDILLVRGGTYIEKVWLNNSGTASLPITVSAYTGEFPVIDGNGTLPVGDWDGLLGLRGNYLHVSGLEVRNTIAGNHAVGVYLIGHDNTISGLNVHNIYYNGILINGDNCIVEDCQLWESCRVNLNGTQTSWPSGLTAARDGVDGITSNAIMRRNIVHNNWGEGFSTYQANGTIMRDNTVYDNWAMNIYVSDATNVTVERNIVYNTTSYSPRGGVLHGITLADEISNGGTIPHSANMTIINNFLYRATISAHSWNEAAAGPVGLTNVRIAYNTVVNGTLSTAASNNTGSQIRNNIFTISTGHSVPTSTGITFSNNAWAATPPSTAAGTGDYVGNAQVAQTGPTGPGTLTTNFFKISSTSPVINHGIAMSGITTDYFGITRSNPPDIGGHEYVTSTIAVTGVTLSPPTLALNVGATGQLIATVAPANATNKTVTWSTSNASFATVSTTGLVTAVAAGSATITVTTQDGGFTATCAVTVSTGAVNLALNKTVQVSSEQSASYAKAYAVDGIGTTRWSSTFSDPQWIYVDLGANYTINRVVLNWEAAYATAYQIQVSNDATTWTNIYSTTTGNGGIDDLIVSGTGRYVRMNGTARATAYGYSLYEFEVYGNINLLLNPGFESGTTSWSGNSSTITQVATPHHLGTYGCSVTARTSTSGGPIQTVTTSVAANGSGTYHAEAWVMMASGTANMTITINYRYNNVDYYSGTTSTSVGTTWTKISGDIPILYTGTLQNCRFYIETTTGTASFYADDCMLQFGPGLKSAKLPTATIIDKVNVPKLYPNPATTNLTIDIPGFQKNEQMKIFNAVGKLTKVVNVSSSRQQINIEDLPNGIYIINLTYSPNLPLKFIKQ
jgi:parallel beta-helix repeat protein